MSKTYVSLSLAILAGLSLSSSLLAQPWEKAYGLATSEEEGGSGDRRDLYLVQPNDKASTGCEKEWWPDGYEWRWEPRQLDPRIDKVVIQEEVAVDGSRDDTVIRIRQ